MKKPSVSPIPAVKNPLLPMFIQGLAGLLALAIILGCWFYVRRERAAQVGVASRQMDSLAALAADDVARALFGARDSLRLLSRMPAMRDCRHAGWLSPPLSRAEALAEGLAGLLEDWFDQGRRQAGSFREGLALTLDLAMAGMRRAVYDQGFLELADPWLNAVEGKAAGLLGLRGSLYAPTGGAGDPGGLAWARGDPALGNALRQLFRLPLTLARPEAALIDDLLALGPPTLGDPDEVGRLLTVSLSDRDLIRSVTVRNLAGRSLLTATEIGDEIQLLVGWLGRVARAARSFYSGPVAFDEGLGRPLWQMAVPLRDQDREAFALLTARVDLDFLREMTEKTRFAQGAHLMIVDEEGVVIGHPRYSMVVNQVNAARANPAVAAVLRGEEGVDELRLGGIPHLVAYRQLKKIDEGNLPGWGVLVLAPVGELLPGSGPTVFLALAVAGISLFILFYVSTILLAWVDEDNWG